MGINFSLGEKLWGKENKNGLEIEKLKLDNLEKEKRINNLNKLVNDLINKEMKFDTEVKLFICLKIENLVKKFENLDIKVKDLAERVESNKLELNRVERKIENLHKKFKNTCLTYDRRIV